MFDGSLRRITVSLFVLALAVGVAQAILPTPHLVMLLNGAVVGSAVSVFVAYRRLVWHAFGLVDLPADAAVFVISVVLLWLVVMIGIANSLSLRIIFGIELPASTGHMTILMRLASITAAVLQVAAPNMTSGVFFSRDTKLLVRAGVLGAVAALALYLAQIGAPRL